VFIRFAHLVVVGLLLTACAPAGTHYEVGSFTPTPNSDAALAQYPLAAPQPAMPAHRETVEDGRAWDNRISTGACTRIRDRRYDRPEDIAECNRDYASSPMCVDYKHYAKIWFDMADNPTPGLDLLPFETNVINELGSNRQPSNPPYWSSPQYRAMLQRMLVVAISTDRKMKWGNSDQFSEFAYKNCLEGHPL
jgi:hypothetical protein